MTPHPSQSKHRLSDWNTNITLAPEDQPNALTQSEIECQKVLAVKLGYVLKRDIWRKLTIAFHIRWDIQASGPGKFPSVYRPAVDEACARLLDEGSRMMVDCLSPHLLGADPRTVYICSRSHCCTREYYYNEPGTCRRRRRLPPATPPRWTPAPTPQYRSSCTYRPRGDAT